MKLRFGNKEPEDLRRQVTEVIWKYATGMLAISCVMGSVSHTFVIPVAVILGAAGATAVVWVSSGEEKKSPTGLADLEERLRKIDDRLANVEVLSNFDRLLAEKTVAAEREKAN